jgi:hypothetical protein
MRLGWESRFVVVRGGIEPLNERTEIRAERAQEKIEWCISAMRCGDSYFVWEIVPRENRRALLRANCDAHFQGCQTNTLQFVARRRLLLRPDIPQLQLFAFTCAPVISLQICA